MFGIRILAVPSFQLPSAAQCTKITVSNEFATGCVKDRKHTRITNTHTDKYGLAYGHTYMYICMWVHCVSVPDREGQGKGGDTRIVGRSHVWMGL